MNQEELDAHIAAKDKELRVKLSTKTGRKEHAQDMLMHGIATVLGYWTESYPHEVDALDTDESRAEFGATLQQQADRVAKMFGYERAWAS